MRTVVLVRATCVICSQTLVHRAAGAEDVREVVALAQLPLQPDVLLDQPLAVGLDQALDLDRMRDHRRDDAEELAGALVVAFRLEAQLEREHARRRGGSAAAARRRTIRSGSPGSPLAERGLAADPRHDDRTAGREHLARQRAAPACRSARRDRGPRRPTRPLRAATGRSTTARRRRARRRATARESRARGAATPGSSSRSPAPGSPPAATSACGSRRVGGAPRSLWAALTGHVRCSVISRFILCCASRPRCR